MTGSDGSDTGASKVENFLEGASESIASRVAMGLNKLGLALKSQAWAGAGRCGLTPTQGQILALLRTRSGRAMRLTDVACELSISAPTASDSVRALVDKGLIRKARAPGDARAVALELTIEGCTEAERAATWPAFLLTAIDALSDREQTAFMIGLTKIIAVLIERGQIPMQRMCLLCRHFQPHAHPGAERTHHCVLLDVPLAIQQLRLDCPEHAAAEPEVRRQRLEVLRSF